MTVLSMYRTRDGVPTSADLAVISIDDASGLVVIPETEVPPTSTGVYSYSTPALVPGRYAATWVFTQVDVPTETIVRTFQVDAAQELTDGILLMDLEQIVARRIGPYRKLRTGPGSTSTAVKVPRLQSSIGFGSYEDQYLLRRGLSWGGDLIPNFSDDDRVRLVSTYEPTTGTLTTDRAYTLAPPADEVLELHALDPDEELRPAVVDGLRRCFFWDTAVVSVTGTSLYDLNVTELLPWVTTVQQVNRAGMSYTNSRLPPRRLPWFQPYRSGKDIRITSYGGAVGDLTLEVLRPAFSYVNGETSVTGPNDDLDVVYVDRDYAAWAAVLECWKNYPEVLTPLAVQAMRPSREDAASEFSRKSLTLVQQVPEFRQIDFGPITIDQIGNLAEPVT